MKFTSNYGIKLDIAKVIGEEIPPVEINGSGTFEGSAQDIVTIMQAIPGLVREIRAAIEGPIEQPKADGPSEDLKEYLASVDSVVKTANDKGLNLVVVGTDKAGILFQTVPMSPIDRLLHHADKLRKDAGKSTLGGVKKPAQAATCGSAPCGSTGSTSGNGWPGF